MSVLQEITVYDGRRRQALDLADITLNLPPLKELQEITIVDHTGRPYVFKLLKDRPETPPLDGLDDTISCENLVIYLNDIKEIFKILTDDQRNIVMHVYYVYKNKKNMQNDTSEEYDENPKIFLQGPAGSGKSTIIDLIEKLITWEENKSSDSPNKIKVLKCAFTGKAASNIDGVTLNSIFSIPIYITRSLKKKRLDSKKDLLQSCIFFICDEISMVGQRLMDSVNMRLQQIFDNTKLYGNRFVLLVGDLYQIDPVQQKRLYPNSELWTCCEFYEMTKIIRQDDERFINALNNFRDSRMTQEDIALLKSREIEDINEVPDSVIHLFYKNNRVDDYNDVKIQKSNAKEEIVNVIEDDDKWRPSNLRVKLGIRYMITYNMDVGDGLANGTTGVVKGFDYDKDSNVVVIWMEFHSYLIGKRSRAAYFKQNSKPGFENWVPIHRSKVVVKYKDNPKVGKTVGNMFPLRAAEAITVHKSQGQTYHDGVCIHITDDQKDDLRTDKSLQYVALTRVKRLEDLYICGKLNFSVTNSNKFIRKKNELDRLRNEKKLKLAYETFEDNISDVLIFLNTGLTFNEHHQFISTDKWYSNGSLLIFTETNTIETDEIEIPNFEIAFRSDCQTALRSEGEITCYKKASTSVEAISSMTDDENKIHLTLMLYEKYLYIITAVKGNLNDDDFKLAINKFISQYVKDKKCILFIGNCNCDSNNTPSLSEFFDEFNFIKKISCDVSTTNEKSQFDMVFTRNFEMQEDNIGFYEYIPSPHKPIYVKLPITSESKRCPDEAQPVASRNASNSEQNNAQGEFFSIPSDSCPNPTKKKKVPNKVQEKGTKRNYKKK